MKMNVSVQEAAKMIGIQASKMQEYVETGDVPAWRDGRNWKIPVNMLKEWNSQKALEQSERRRHDTEAKDS